MLKTTLGVVVAISIAAVASSSQVVAEELYGEEVYDGNGAVVEAIDQYKVYWRRDWEFGGETMVYTGIANDRYDLGQWILGFSGRVPLSHRTSLFGGVQYILPSTSPGNDAPNGVGNSYSEETWNVSFGLVWTFGSGSCCGQNNPLLPVADNASFAVAAPVGGL